MNKKRLLTILTAMIVFCGYSFAADLVSGSSSVQFKVSLSFEKNINITHFDNSGNEGRISVLQSTPVPVSVALNVISSGVYIDSVHIKHYHEGASEASAEWEPFTYGNGKYSALLTDLDSANYIDGIYQVKVEYSKDSVPQTAYVESFKLYNPGIRHLQLSQISSVDKQMVLVGFSSGTPADIEVLYKVDGSSDIKTLAVNRIEGNDVYNLASAVAAIEGSNNVEYKFKMVVPESIAGEGVSEANRTKYYPYDNSWINVPITNASSIVTEDGGSIEIGSGDQTGGGNLVVVVPPGTAPGGGVGVIELPPPGSGGRRARSPAVIPVGTNDVIEKFYATTDGNHQILAPGIPFDPPLTVQYTLNQAQSKDGLRRYFAYSPNGTDNWVKLETTLNNGVLQSQLTESGYFAVFAIYNVSRADSEYRPLSRAFKPGEKVTFRNIQPGDSVTIYNLRGQQVAKLITVNGLGEIDWDGKKDGSYAESGSYIYQIKAGDKTISGSLRFYR